MSIFHFRVKWSIFTNFKMEILISKFVVGNTPFWVPLKKNQQYLNVFVVLPKDSVSLHIWEFAISDI